MGQGRGAGPSWGPGVTGTKHPPEAGRLFTTVTEFEEPLKPPIVPPTPEPLETDEVSRQGQVQGHQLRQLWAEDWRCRGGPQG